MKKCVFVMAVMFIHANVYAINMPWSPQQEKKPVQQKDPAKAAVVEKVEPAAPANAVVVTPVPPEKAVVSNTTTPANAVAAIPQPAPAAAAPQKKLTKEEIIVRINDVLKGRPNIAAAIKGLEVKQEGGVAVCRYNGKKLEELDEETLFRVLSMVNQQVSLDNLQKFDLQQKQLKNLQQIDQINRTQRALREQQALTKSAVPKIYTPPKIPRTR